MPGQIRLAVILLWISAVLKLADRLLSISLDPTAHTFSDLGRNLRAEAIIAAIGMGMLIHLTSRRHRWARTAVLLCTAGGWGLSWVWISVLKAGAEYESWQWMGFALDTIIQITALFLLYLGKGADWFRTAVRPPGDGL